MPTIDPNMLPVDILRLALEREKEAHAFYTEAAGRVTLPATRDALLEMAEEERSHIRKIEEILDRYFYHDN